MSRPARCVHCGRDWNANQLCWALGGDFSCVSELTRIDRTADFDRDKPVHAEPLKSERLRQMTAADATRALDQQRPPPDLFDAIFSQPPGPVAATQKQTLSPWQQMEAGLSAYLGKPVRLRFIQTDDAVVLEQVIHCRVTYTPKIETVPK